MKRTMTPEEYEQWSRLPHAVIRRRFWWAFDSKSRSTRRGPSRFHCSLEYDDLASEGNLALMNAWSLYEEGRKTNGRCTSFKTYAYRSIFNQVSRYIELNLSKTPEPSGLDAAMRKGQRSRGCVLFTDIGAEGAVLSEWQPLAAKVTETPDEEVAKEEWIETCIAQLQKELGKRKTKILLRWANGERLEKLGRSLGVTRQWAMVLINEWLVAASAILADREEDSWDK